MLHLSIKKLHNHVIIEIMNFGARLKEEIEYTGIQYKELAAKADVKLRALFTYVASNPSMPPADVAVRIAEVLNVSVEYLVNGKKTDSSTTHRQPTNLPQKQVNLLHSFNNLSQIEQKAVIKLIETLCEQHIEK